MRTSDFDIQVPRELIAQEPVEPRDSSRLLFVDRLGRFRMHTRFFALPDFLKEGDCLVFNDSRVIPARLKGHKSGSPMEKIVILLLHKEEDRHWEALVEVGEVGEGDCIAFTGFESRVMSLLEKVGKRGERVITVHIPDESKIDGIGEAPIPPYIHGYKGDSERYQTVYSKIKGSAAAPTAGLHFTNNLMERLRQKGVILAFVTLNVGLDTFMPVLEDEPEKHKMYTEYCEMSREVADKLNEVRKNGGRIIGVGTTSVRTMESAHYNGRFEGIGSWTGIYILPGYKFKSVDGMVTNFHYPKSTNLMMVSAFAGLDNIKRAYEEAVKEGYRFYSFGDAMLIL